MVGKRLAKNRSLIRRAAVSIYKHGHTAESAMKGMGYAEKTARHKPQTLTANPIFKEEVSLLRTELLLEDKKILKKVAHTMIAGLKAKEIKFFQNEGEVQETRQVISWSERRQYAELIAKVFGQLNPDGDDGSKGGNIYNLTLFLQMVQAAEKERGLT